MSLAGLVFAGGLVLVCVGAALAWSAQNDPAASPFAETQRGHLRRLDGASASGRVVFLGASTFQGLDTSAVTPIGLNLSLGGDTLAGLTRRAADYRSLATARAVVLNVGLNDLLHDCAFPGARLDELLALFPATTPLVVVGVQQVDTRSQRRPCDGALPVLIAGYNELLSRACGARAGCRFVANPAAAASDAGGDRALLETDGVHLSPRGYGLLVKVLRQALGAVAPAECVPS